MTACEESHYVAIVAAVDNVEIYAKGDVDCQACRARTIGKRTLAIDLLRSRDAQVQA